MILKYMDCITMRLASLFCCILFCLSSSFAQDSCMFYLYKNFYVFDDYFSADEFEQAYYNDGVRDMIIRLNETTFTDSFRIILKISNKKSMQYFEGNQHLEPKSCEAFIEDNFRDKKLTFKEINIDTFKNAYRCGEKFSLVRKNDSIYIKLNNKLYFRYIISTDTVWNIYGKPELNLSVGTFSTIFIQKEDRLFFGRMIPTLLFKEIYYNREELIWYDEATMAPIRTQIVFPDHSYYLTELMTIYQFDFR